MIELWVATILVLQTPNSLDVREQQKRQADSCLNHQEGLASLLGALDQPNDDSRSAATARAIQSDCSAAADALQADEWSAPCARFLSQHANVAAAMGDIFEGRRRRDDTPGFIYSGWQEHATRCYQITQIEGE